MQMYRRTLDGTPLGEITELSVLTNEKYNTLIVTKSLEDDGYHVVFGLGLVVEDPERPNPGSVSNQHFKAFATNGQLIQTKLVPESSTSTKRPK